MQPHAPDYTSDNGLANSTTDVGKCSTPHDYVLWKILLTVGALLVCVLLILRDKCKPELALLGVLTILTAACVISPSQAFSGFSNPALFTVLVSFVVAAGISATGGVDFLLLKLLGKPLNVPAAQVRLLLLVLCLAALVNSTPVVAVLIPIVTKWCRNNGFPPAQLLVPLSFAALLGGSMTLMGSPTNLLIAGLLKDYTSKAGSPVAFAIFDILRYAGPVALWGCCGIILISPALLPGYFTAKKEGAEADDQFLVGLCVTAWSQIIGKSIEAAGLRNLENLFLVSVRRRNQVFHAVSPTFVLDVGDVMYFTGVLDKAQELSLMYQLQFVTDAPHLSELGAGVLGRTASQPLRAMSSTTSGPLRTRSRVLIGPSDDESSMELELLDSPRHSLATKSFATEMGSLVRAVIKTDAPIVGCTIEQINFLDTFDAVVLGITKAGTMVEGPLANVVCQPHDAILMAVGGSFWVDESGRVEAAFDGVRRVGRKYLGRVYSFGVEVKGAELLGLNSHDAGLSHHATLTAIERAGAPGDESEWYRGPAAATQPLRQGDVLWMSGTIEGLKQLRKTKGLRLCGVSRGEGPLLKQQLVQVVLAARSNLVGRTVRDCRFRTQYNAAIVAVHRQGQQLHCKIGDIVLQPGDTLLLDTGRSFLERHQHDATFALVTQLSDEPDDERRWGATAVAVGVTSLAVVLSALGLLDLLVAFLVASGCMLVTGCMDAQDMTKYIHMDAILTMGAALGIGKALESSGLACLLTSLLVSRVSSPTLLLPLLYVTVALLSQVVDNTAVVGIVFPVAAPLAEQTGVDMSLMACSMMLGSNAVFTSPWAYQTNLMVLAAGGYRVSTFLKFGGVLQLWQLCSTMILLTWPQYWPIMWGVTLQAALIVFVGCPVLAAAMGFKRKKAR